MTRTYRVFCASEAIAPITHMSRTEGNEAIVAREPVATPLGVAWVPCLSGNAIRHRLVREPGMRWLVDEYDLAGKLSLPQLNFLFHGGALTDGGGREDTRRIADWQRLWPLGRLLGGSLPDQILAGSLLVGRGTLVCEENRSALSSFAEIPDRLRSAESFLSSYQYTRGNSRKSGMVVLADGEESASSLMIFSGQSVMRGAVFLHDFTLKHASIEELGGLLFSLRLWTADGATIGGQSARGHGRLALSVIAPDFDPEKAVAAYLEYARSVKDDAIAWLAAAFAKAEKVPAKSKGKGKVADAPAD